MTAKERCVLERAAQLLEPGDELKLAAARPERSLLFGRLGGTIRFDYDDQPTLGPWYCSRSGDTFDVLSKTPELALERAEARDRWRALQGPEVAA